MSSVSIDSTGACSAAEPPASGKTGGHPTPAHGHGQNSSRTKHLNSFLYLHETHPFHPPYCTWRGGEAAPEILPSGPTS